ncbi:MAG TPA: hypothetical protein VLW17_03140 [Thermoanaerobaculaceae bacterium]|nr:hypothetical protein [Thermoanaerobaculaceae bacterium]
MRRSLIVLALTLAVAALIAAPAFAVETNGFGRGHVRALTALPPAGWQAFHWDGTAPTPCLENPFTFNVGDAGAVLKVTDAFVDGDQFAVYDNLVLLGNTSAATDDGTQDGSNPDAAFVDPKFSHGTFALGPGSHSITITTIAEATCPDCSDGSGFLRLDPTAIPTTNWIGIAVLIALLAAVGGYFLFRRLHA